MGKSDSQLLTSFFDGVVDRFVDQITHRVVGREWGSIPDVHAMFRDVRRIVRPDIQRLADNLAKRILRGVPRSSHEVNKRRVLPRKTCYRFRCWETNGNDSLRFYCSQAWQCRVSDVFGRGTFSIRR